MNEILRASQDCLLGLTNNDPHLISVSYLKLTHQIQFLIDILDGAVDEEDDSVRTHAEALILALLLLRDHAEIHLHDQGEGSDTQSIELNPENVTEFRRQGMPWAKIAKLYQISRSTMYNYRVKHGIHEPNSKISDNDLLNFIGDSVKTHPNAGVRLTRGALLSKGYIVSQEKVNHFLRVIDPLGVARRRSKRIVRRVYRVKNANYMWHIDGNHKLVMYKFIIHGCIDGFSRRIIYINVAPNNKASTVLGMFKSGIIECGTPKRVRADRGVENVAVKSYMRSLSPSANPYIEGRSVHNTRIERLWRDVNMQVTSVFKMRFMQLEDNGLLDENSKLDLFCLHYIFLPRIQSSLRDFHNMWNNHAMSTLHSRTPLQVWMIGMQNRRLHDFNPFDDEEGGSIELENTADDGDRDELFLRMECQNIIRDPLEDDGNNGIDHYLRLRHHLLAIMTGTRN